MSADSHRGEVARLRRELDDARSEITAASAVLSHLEAAADRVRRGTDVGDGGAAITAFRRYLRGPARPESLAYLTKQYVNTEGGTTTALAAERAPASGDVDGFVRDLGTHIDGGGVDAATLQSDFETLVTDGTAADLDALVALFEHAVTAARGYRDDRKAALNNANWTDGTPGDPGKLQSFLDGLEDELSLLSSEPVAMLPVRLETRFVFPNDDSSPRLTTQGTATGVGDYNRTDPGEAELRVRVYPDQIHVDSHEPELTIQEEQWGRNFWAQVWLACQPIQDVSEGEGSGQSGSASTAPTGDTADSVDPEARYSISYPSEKVPDDLEPMLSDLLTDWQAKFSTDGAAFYREVKERAWGQLVDRFGRERAAHIVHALAPENASEAMLAGYGSQSRVPFEDSVPQLSFPAVDLKPASWSRQPQAALLPDRWIAIGHWRHTDADPGDTTRLRVTGTAIRQPLPVGPNPARLGSEDPSDEPGDAPPGMEWMADWAAAKRAGMGLTITSDDLDGTDPSEVIFEEFLVVGVRASESGATVTDRLESLLDAHHYTDGLEVLERGTPTNNSDEKDAGYTTKDDPSESVTQECGPPLSEFGDFSDGDLLARALGLSDPGDGMDHVFAHVEGADQRSQANARHMNSLLWSGTIGYYLRNLLIDNRWTDRPSIWAGQSERPPKSFPGNPATELGETLKRIDAWRRHFIRYVRAGGPFPPLRVGLEPYGVLPAESIGAIGEEPATGTDTGSGAGYRIGRRADDPTVTDRIRAPTGEHRIDTSRVGGTDGSAGDQQDPTDGSAAETDRGTAATPTDTPGQVDPSGYSVAVSEPTTQVDQDLYGSSFDPAVPKTSTAETTGTLANAGFSTDGGATARIRQRAFRVDDEFPDDLRSWLGPVTKKWDESFDVVPRVGGGQSDTSAVDQILGREAWADDFVRERLFGLDMFNRKHGWTAADVRDVLGSPEKLRGMLQEYGMESLDPRLAWMIPDFTLGPDPESTETRPVSLVTDGRESEYLGHLYTESLDFLKTMGYPFGLEDLVVDRKALKSAMGWGDEIDPLSDQQLVMHLLLTEPEHGKLDDLRASQTIDIGDDVSPRAASTYGLKMTNLVNTDGDSIQNTLFKQVTRFSTIQAYVGGRIRLGLKWDTLDLDDASRFLGPDSEPSAGDDGYTQSPVPDPSVHDAQTRSVWDWLEAEVPDQYRLRIESDDSAYANGRGMGVDLESDTAYTTYAKLLWETSSPLNRFDTPTVDPRMREVFDAIEYLSDQDDEDVGRLFGETLDLASHRLDAWWTSLATRRLFEHRETQEADFYDGAEFEFVGDHFRRGEDTESSPELGPTETESGDGYSATTADQGATGVESVQPVAGRTRFGNVANREIQLSESDYRLSKQVGSDADGLAGTDESTTEPSGRSSDDTGPVTYVGAYGYVENLHADVLDEKLETAPSATGGTDSEYIHAPSPQHATTAAILRSGRANHSEDDGSFEDGDLANLLDIDLSPGRIRAARRVLAGIREGQMLGDLLGYRFERRLLEKSQAFNEAHEQGEIVLPKYKFALRREFPGKEDKLARGGDEDGDGQLDVGTEAAASDVLDGYDMFTTWQEKDGDESAFFGSIPYGGAGGDTLAAAMSSDELTAMAELVREIEALVDAVTDLLIAENVHQLGKGNFARAGGQLDDLVRGKAVADPEVAQTPRSEVGVTHRLGVAFGDPATATADSGWADGTSVLDPETLSGAGSGSSYSSLGSNTALTLQPRADAEPNLDAWLGDLLPDPTRVSCRASLTWDAPRDFASGTFVTPTSEGIVTVGDLDFQPDLVVLELAHGVPDGGVTGPGGDFGVTHGVALRSADGGATQHSTSVGTHLEGSDAGAYVDENHALNVHLHDPDGKHGRLRGELRFTADGFDVSFDTVSARGQATDGLVVSYRAYALADRSNVEIGTFTADGTGSIPLDVTADHALFFGNTVARATGTERTTNGAAGFTQGVAVAGDGGVSQHALGSSIDPATGTFVSGVRDDRAFYLPFSSDGSVAGTTSLQVTGLGESIDLSYAAQHAGGASDAGRVLTYVAIGSDEDVPTPEVGVVDGSGSRSAGDTTTIQTGFEPGLIELVALPDVTATGSGDGVTVGGLATGAATGVGEQRTLHHSVRGDGEGGFIATGTETGGDAIVLPALAADGTADAEDVVRVTGRSESGFTLTFPSVADGNQVVAWRAWPASPETVTHVAETGITLADLDLSPLDATYLTQRNQKAGASQLEQRIRYHLIRNPPSHEPPVPADATADLEFETTAPGATGPDPLSVGTVLEVIASIRELVQGSRPMDAGDVGHPDETDTTGYTEGTVTELANRADEAQDRLAATGRVIENRVDLLDPDAESARPVTAQVSALHDAVRAFTREVPFDGLAAAAADIRTTLSTDGSGFTNDLAALRAHLPAGSTDRDERDFDFEVAPAPNQELGAATQHQQATLDVDVWSTTAGEWFAESRQVRTDQDGECYFEMDFSDVRPGTGFVAVLSDGASVEAVTTGIVLIPEDAMLVRPAPGEVVVGETPDHSDTTLRLTITETGAGSPIHASDVETDADGRFSVTVDFDGVDPWTRFEVEATADGATVHTDEVYARAAPGGVVEGSEVLGPTLWIDDRAGEFVPRGDSPAGTLDAAIRDGTDWAAIRTELGSFRALNGKTSGSGAGTPPQKDIDAVAALIDDGTGPALESLDLEAIDAAVDQVTDVVEDFGLAEMFDVTGRPDRAGGTRFWPVTAAIEDADAQARLSTLVDHPDAVFEHGIAAYGFAPELWDVLGTESRGVFPEGEDDVERLASYLHALAEYLPTVLADPAMASTLSDPEGFVRHFRALLYHPESAPAGQERNTFLADFRRFVRQPLLGGLPRIDDALENVDAERPFYDRERTLLSTRQGENEAALRPEHELEERRRELAAEVGEDAPMWETGLETRERDDLSGGTPVTDCRFLLEGFRRTFLQTYFDTLDTGGGAKPPAKSRSAFASTFAGRLSTLSTVVDDHASNLDAARQAGAFDEAFRRGVLETLRRAMLRASYFGVYGSTPQSVEGGQPSDEATLLAQARTVHQTVKSRFRESSDLAAGATSDRPVDQRVERQIGRLEALFGEDFQVLPIFKPVNGAELTATFGRSESLQDGDPMAAETWLQRVARVRDQSATFRRALSYAETVTKVRHRDLTVGQLPHRQHERWVGLDGVDPAPGRLSLVMQEAAGFDGNYDTDRMTGLFVDELEESVPQETETTGVAINYDDPNATAPHSILLALPDEKSGWSTPHLSTVVRDTMRLARYRLVDLEDMGDDPFGQLLPMLVFPNNDNVPPDAPSLDLDRIKQYHQATPDWWKVRQRAMMNAEPVYQLEKPTLEYELSTDVGGEN